jgi:hypothetical protein
LDHLDELSIYHCPSLNSAALASLVRLPRLRILDLRNNGIDDAAVKHLKQIQSLRILKISDTKISASGVAELQAALPKCAVFWSGGAIIPGTTNPTVAAAATAASTPQSAISNPQSGSSGFALEFNGTDTYVDLPTLDYDGSHPITLEATIVTNQIQIQDRGIIVGDAVGDVGLLLICPSGTGPRKDHGLFIVADDGNAGVYQHLYSAAAVVASRITHVAGVVTPQTAYLFIDGELNAKNQLSGKYRRGDVCFTIGATAHDGPNPDRVDDVFFGAIDELRISKTARYTNNFKPPARFVSDKDTIALYHFDEGHGDVLTDSSGNNHHGKILSAKWIPGIAGGPTVSSRSLRAD